MCGSAAADDREQVGTGRGLLHALRRHERWSAVIGDLYKTSVFALCDWIDSPQAKACRTSFGLAGEGELVGRAIRTKLLSAELRPDQKDSDSLPDYALLDECYGG